MFRNKVFIFLNGNTNPLVSFQNDDLMMVIIVPREIDGLSEIENNLEKIKLDYEKDLRYKREICLSLPKFKIETTTELIPHLSNVSHHCSLLRSFVLKQTKNYKENQKQISSIVRNEKGVW